MLGSPVTLGLSVGIRPEERAGSLSPRGAEFPSCGMDIADMYVYTKVIT